MQISRYGAVPAYIVAGSLITIPFLDTVLSVWPFRFEQIDWRFGAVGLASRAIMTPALGVLIFFCLALLNQNRRILLTLSLLSGLFFVLLVGVSGLFLLDTVQLRAQVRPELKTAFDVSAVVALGKLALGMTISGSLTIFPRRAAKLIRITLETNRPPHAELIGALSGSTTL